MQATEQNDLEQLSGDARQSGHRACGAPTLLLVHLDMTPQQRLVIHPGNRLSALNVSSMRKAASCCQPVSGAPRLKVLWSGKVPDNFSDCLRTWRCRVLQLSHQEASDIWVTLQDRGQASRAQVAHAASSTTDTQNLPKTSATGRCQSFL